MLNAGGATEKVTLLKFLFRTQNQHKLLAQNRKSVESSGITNQLQSITIDDLLLVDSHTQDIPAFFMQNRYN